MPKCHEKILNKFEPIQKKNISDQQPDPQKTSIRKSDSICKFFAKFRFY